MTFNNVFDVNVKIRKFFSIHFTITTIISIRQACQCQIFLLLLICFWNEFFFAVFFWSWSTDNDEQCLMMMMTMVIRIVFSWPICSQNRWSIVVFEQKTVIVSDWDILLPNIHTHIHEWKIIEWQVTHVYLYTQTHGYILLLILLRIYDPLSHLHW